MPKQLSRCCRAEIELTWEERPNHFKCNECCRIVGEPYELKYLSCYDEPHTLWQAVWKINELIDAVNKIQEWWQTPALDKYTIDSLLLQVSQHQEAIDDMQNTIAKLNQYESENFVCRGKTKILWKALDDMLLDSALELWQLPSEIGERMDKIDNQTARHESYSTHLIRSTATDTNFETKRTPLDDLVDEIDELYPVEETRQITIRKKTLKKILERYFIS